MILWQSPISSHYINIVHKCGFHRAYFDSMSVCVCVQCIFCCICFNVCKDSFAHKLSRVDRRYYTQPNVDPRCYFQCFDKDSSLCACVCLWRFTVTVFVWIRNLAMHLFEFSLAHRAYNRIVNTTRNLQDWRHNVTISFGTVKENLSSKIS